MVNGEGIALGRLHHAGYLRTAAGKNAADATRVLRCGLVRLRLHHQRCGDPRPSWSTRFRLVWSDVMPVPEVARMARAK